MLFTRKVPKNTNSQTLAFQRYLSQVYEVLTGRFGLLRDVKVSRQDFEGDETTIHGSFRDLDSPGGSYLYRITMDENHTGHWFPRIAYLTPLRTVGVPLEDPIEEEFVACWFRLFVDGQFRLRVIIYKREHSNDLIPGGPPGTPLSGGTSYIDRHNII